MRLSRIQHLMPIPARPIVLHRGLGRNAAFAQFIDPDSWDIVAYVQDVATDSEDDTPVVSFAQWREHLCAIPSAFLALDPRERRAHVERVRTAGGAIAHIDVVGSAISRKTTFAEGTLVSRGALFVGSAITVGRYTIVQTPASLGHDIVIGDFVTIHPSAAVSGHVVIEDDVTVGIGAVIVNGRAEKPLRIGKGAYLAHGAIVTTSVKAGKTVFGNPARPICL